MKKNGPEAHLTPSGSNSSNDRGAWTAEDAMNGRGAYGTGIVVTALLMSSPLARAQKQYAAGLSARQCHQTAGDRIPDVLGGAARQGEAVADVRGGAGSTDDHS